MTEEIKPPIYIDPGRCLAYEDLSMAPPFVFRNVTSRVFPIKANMAHLEYFIDQYLNNDIPPQIAQFRPAMPYVYFMMLNYGSMGPKTVQAQNIGWVSQHEVTFTVPLEWWFKDEQGQFVFKDWAFVSPFIFVDDELSLITGREVYGWPKVPSKIHAEPTLWSQDPRAPSRLFALETPLFPKAYAGAREESWVLLQIERDPPLTWAEFPINPYNPWSPLWALPNAARAWFALIEDTLEMITALPIRGYRSNRSPTALLSMYRTLGMNFSSLLPMQYCKSSSPSVVDRSRELSIKQITLKQFPRADKPSKACYQALIESDMGIERVNQIGMLGDENLLRGDPSGGFTIRINRYTGQPIVESLGLEIDREELGGDPPVAIFKPTLPFWTDVDLYYGKGQAICSRTYQSPEDHEKVGILWLNEQTDPPQPVPPINGNGPLKDIPYNTARAAATQPVSGPFVFDNVNVQVYPLLADSNQLQKLLDKSLNTPLTTTELNFKPFSSYVYMMVTGYVEENGQMYSEANNIGLWAGREVAFCIPVKCYRKNNLISVALVSPFVYRSSGRAVITDREVIGCPALQATIEGPPDMWFEDPGPDGSRRMVKVDTDVFPALYLGQRSEQKTLIEIDSKEILPSSSTEEWHCVATIWGEEIIKELKGKTKLNNEHETEVRNAMALALEILAAESPINFVHLKNYRDAYDVDKACYQALVKRTRRISCIQAVQEIDQRVHVNIHRYQGHPIQEALGLKAKYLDLTGGTGKEIFQPIRPFWMKVDIEEKLCDVVCWRDPRKDNWYGNHPWLSDSGTPPPPPAPPQDPSQCPYFLVSCPEGVGLKTEGIPTHWQHLKGYTKKMGLPLRTAQQSIQNLDEVQVVIETILSESPRPRDSSQKKRTRKTTDSKRPFYIRRDSVGPEIESRHSEKRHAPNLKIFNKEWWYWDLGKPKKISRPRKGKAKQGKGNKSSDIG